MRANSDQRGKKIFAFIAGALITGVLVPALHAQFRLGGSRPTVLAPRRAAPLQSGHAAQGARPPAPSQPALNLTLVDPGPIGIQTTSATFPVSVPPGGTRVLTTQPVNESDPLKQGWARVEFGGNTLYAANIAVGQGWTTIFTLTNTGGAAVNGTLILTGQDGNPFTVTASAPDATFSPSASSSADRNALAAGLSGVAAFQQTEGGNLKTIAGVLDSPLVQFATIPVDDDSSKDQITGYAVANPGGQAVTVKLALVREDGTVEPGTDITPPGLNPLGPGMQVSRFVFQDFPSRNPFIFRGSMVLRAQGPGKIVPVAIVFKKGLIYAIPVIPEKASTVPN